MIRLAFIQLTDDQGRDVALCPEDIAQVSEAAGGSIVSFKDGRPPLRLQTTVADVVTAITTKWTEYTTALGDPA